MENIIPIPSNLFVTINGVNIQFNWQIKWEEYKESCDKVELNLIKINENENENDFDIKINEPNFYKMFQVNFENQIQLMNYECHYNQFEYGVYFVSIRQNEHYTIWKNDKQENMKLIISPPPILLIETVRLNENICILRIDFEVFTELLFEIRLFVYKENQWNYEKGLYDESLAFPKIKTTNKKGIRRIAIPGIPSDFKCKFEITPILSNGIFIQSQEHYYSNILDPFHFNDDSDKTICTICYDPVPLNELHSKIISEVPLDQLSLQPDLDPFCPSGPNTCCHLFHAKCFHDWISKFGNRKCPNCNKRCTQEVMFKRYVHVICVPIKNKKQKLTLD